MTYFKGNKLNSSLHTFFDLKIYLVFTIVTVQNNKNLICTLSFFMGNTKPCLKMFTFFKNVLINWRSLNCMQYSRKKIKIKNCLPASSSMGSLSLCSLKARYMVLLEPSALKTQINSFQNQFALTGGDKKRGVGRYYSKI